MLHMVPEATVLGLTKGRASTTNLRVSTEGLEKSNHQSPVLRCQTKSSNAVNLETCTPCHEAKKESCLADRGISRHRTKRTKEAQNFAKPHMS